MMMTESYYHGTDFGSPYHSPHRTVPTAAHYSRAVPYGYHDHARYYPRQHNQQYDERSVHDNGELNIQGEQSSRRRIAVACSRCRKRKIKCSGDPGDGSGCSACKSVGPGTGRECTFIRVNSQPLPIANLEILNHMPHPGLYRAPAFDGRDRRASERHQRSQAAIPVLHTRSAFPVDLESAVHSSPVDTYSPCTYGASTMPRQDSFASIYGTEGLRSWSLTCSSAIPPTTSYCDPQTGLAFASMQYPTPQFNRLPSVSSESLSALNMGHLNSSLPSQAAQYRRLPIPYVSQISERPITAPEPVTARPLGSFSTPRIPVNGIHARNNVPWALDTGFSRSGSVSSYLPANTISASSSYSMPPASESALEYQLSSNTQSTGYGSSPELSPRAIAPTLSTSFDSSSSSSGSSGTVRPPMQLCSVTSSQQQVSPVTTADRPSSSRQQLAQNLPSFYSYAMIGSDIRSTTSDQESAVAPSSGAVAYSLPVRSTIGGDESPYVDTTDTAYQPSIQRLRPLPQHSASIDNLCR